MKNKILIIFLLATILILVLLSSKLLDTNNYNDVLAIQNNINDYAFFADSRKSIEQANLFTEDATIEVYSNNEGKYSLSQTRIGKIDIKKGFETLKNFEETTHLNGQSNIAVYENKATNVSYCIAHHVFTENGKKVLLTMSIKYEDKLVKDDKDWLFSKRKLYIQWTDKKIMNQD